MEVNYYGDQSLNSEQRERSLGSSCSSEGYDSWDWRLGRAPSGAVYPVWVQLWTFGDFAVYDVATLLPRADRENL